MLVQDFLRRGGSLGELQQRFAVKATRSTQTPNLVLLKYSQIDSPMAEPLVRECRGLILDEADDWAVVSRSFDKFFNHGEGHAATIDWSTAKVQEKLDGSLCVVYKYGDDWRVQTSGHPDAGGRVGDCDFDFATLFWNIYTEGRRDRTLFYGYDHLCFSFELMTKWNRVVVQHAEPRVQLIGVRDKRTGEEYQIEQFGDAICQPVRSFPLQSIDDITNSFRTMEPLRQEGYVVVDAAFNRIKVKHPGYVAIHHLKEGHSTRRLVEIVQAGEVGEFLTYFPEWRSEFEQIQRRLVDVEAELTAAYDRIKHIDTQKAFAVEAVKTRCSPALFLLRAGKIDSIGAYLRRMQPEHVLTLIGLRDTAVSS